MKSSLFLICISLLFSATSFAQCAPPTVDHWRLISPQESGPIDQVFEIEFNVPEGATHYQLTVYSEYAPDFSIPPATPDNPLIHIDESGVVEAGTNTIEVTIPGSTINTIQSWHYFSVNLQLECADGALSGVQKFYMSAHSMINNPGFQCDENFYNVVLPLPDGPSTVEAFLPVSPNEQDEIIESIQVFVDIGHIYIGDLEVQLESPSGTRIDLMSFPNYLGNANSLSVLFQDGAAELINAGSMAGPRGTFAPSEPLSTFQGEQAAGVWKITVVDSMQMDVGMLGGVCMSINGSGCAAFLSGTAYYDLNSNNMLDGDDIPYSYPVISNSLNDFPFTGGSTGTFHECSMSGAGVLSLENTPAYYTSSTVDFNANQDDVLTGLDLPLHAIPGHYDLEIDLFTASPDAPGFFNTYFVQFENVGTECIDDVEVSVIFPDDMTIHNVSIAGAEIDGQTVSYQVGTICPLESGSFTVTIIMSESAEIDTEVSIYAVIEPMSTDETPYNNEVSIRNPVLAAYDPNDKMVNETAVGPTFMENSAPLKYTVRFQNTGSYYAQNVVVIDTLDSQLDLTSFQLRASSHDVEVTFQENVAYFTFNNIMLPDSTTDLEGSQGFVRFSLEPLPSFSEGDEIHNRVGIYFDFNPPIYTNIATTVYDISIGLKEGALQADAWPNPTSDQLVLVWPNEADVSGIDVFDATGRHFQAMTVTGAARLELNTVHWKPGLYVVQFRGEKAIAPLRVIKQ